MNKKSQGITPFTTTLLPLRSVQLSLQARDSSSSELSPSESHTQKSIATVTHNATASPENTFNKRALRCATDLILPFFLPCTRPPLPTRSRAPAMENRILLGARHPNRGAHELRVSNVERSQSELDDSVRSGARRRSCSRQRLVGVYFFLLSED